MIFQSDVITVEELPQGFAEMVFDAKDESVNKFDARTIQAFGEAVTALSQQSLKGLLITSRKPMFIVGADIAQFTELFTQSADDIMAFNRTFNGFLNGLEALPFPTCVAINGVAMGGGCELSLACDFRVMASDAKIALPEVKLGIFPGWGGTVRLPRITGLDEAVAWIATGKDNRADECMRVGAVDSAVPVDQLRDVALATLTNAAEGKLDWQARRSAKANPLPMNRIESTLAFTTMKAMVAEKAGKHYPAPMAALKSMEKSVGKPLAQALEIEAHYFAQVATNSVTRSLVGIFLSDQYLGRKAKKMAKSVAQPVQRAAVLGAGIMGGGIAYQSALKGTPILMKDIADAGLELGMSEAGKLLAKRVAKGRMQTADMAKIIAAITPTLSYDGFDRVDAVVEAVVEHPKVKSTVLAEAESHMRDDAVLASNTSTISINFLAQSLKRPENFCGMHFFNPVHTMPLVEVIRGEKTSDETIAKTVAYAQKMGKKAIVVNDCPGFLVNRVLFPYFDGFSKLLRDGADFAKVDKAMERFGWPMGPAYLMDVVGLDTAMHAGQVMAAGYPERMQLDFKTAGQALFEAERLGQKNGKGFYNYEPDKRGKPKKKATEESYALLADVVSGQVDVDEQDIVARMMLPMATELARCLEEGIVGSAAEADLALIYGLGFPPFHGGMFRWLDEVGLATVAAWSEQFAHLGASYALTEGMKAKLANNETYYPSASA